MVQVGSMEEIMSCLMCQFSLQFGVCGQSLLFLSGILKNKMPCAITA